MIVRVQIPVYTDRWMRGDRYGVLVKTSRLKKSLIGDKWGDKREIAHVKLEKSGKTVRVILDDCTVV